MNSLRGVILCLFAALICPKGLSAGTLPPPPAAPRDRLVEVIHGVRIPDPYRWLEQLSSPATHGFIAAEQRYTQRLLGQQPSLPLLAHELMPLTRLNTPQSVICRNGRTVILRKPPGAQVASLYLRTSPGRSEVRILDPRRFGKNATLDLLAVSHDGRLIAYGVRHGGTDQLSIHFYDVVQRRSLKDVLPDARYIYWSLLLSPDDKTVYYIRFGSHGPRLYAHRLGGRTPDRLLFGRRLGIKDILQATLSPRGHVLLIQVLHGATGPTDLYLKRTGGSASAQVLVKGQNANFVARAAAGHIYIQTDLDAPRGKIMVAAVNRPQRADWRVLVPQTADTLQSFALAGGRLVLSYLHDAHARLVLLDPATGAMKTVALPGLGTVGDVEGSWSSPRFSYSYTSFATPRTFWSYAFKSGRQQVISGPKLPKWLAGVVTEQVWYRSKDGTRVPMFLVHRGPIRRTSHNPVLLYGYGGFAWAQTPIFSPQEAVWVKNGGIYALANIRGGDEFGETWHSDGDLLNKQNSFDDFAAAARFLIAKHYTVPGRLAIQGMSNGGLLVLVSIVQHPKLFGAAIARYALADMLRYEKFGIAGWWAGEYGSIKNKAQFKALLAYSPYEHVRKGVAYPAVLLVTGADDTRVSPAHSLKMTAALQHASRSGKPVLLLYDSKSGHSGTLPVRTQVAQTAHELAFLVWQLHLRQP